MFAGFDYGTSNCSMGVWSDGAVRVLPVEGTSPLIASTLYAPKPDLDLERGSDAVLDMSAQSFAALRFGEAALGAYLADPTEGYFVKSPKSFLGAPGINESVKERFIAVVAAMMGNVKRNAEAHAGGAIEQVVIGRPVNFQGAGGAAENQQALTMLVAAAREVGFDEVAFQYEPVAAAMEFEARLEKDAKVLVVDVGGGTTDCSFVNVGPSFRGSARRDQDVLGHAGERLGGNDYDQALALKTAMPAFGLGDHLTTGLPIANTYFVDAVSTNDVNAQQRFYGRATGERLEVLVRDASDPERIARLRRVREGRATYRLLRNVELGKIALSDSDAATIELAFVEPGFRVDCVRRDLEQASERLLAHLSGLVDEVLTQVGSQPDVVYLTGGMARSAVVREHLHRVLPDVAFLDSDHFVSVTEGLTIWARQLFGENRD